MNTPAEVLFLQIGRTRYEVASLQHASEMFCAARDRSGNGASETPTPTIVTADGRFVARISYNGRVWPDESWTPASIPIFDNRRNA